MSGHTPGPWIVCRRRVTISVKNKDGEYITENVRYIPNQQANALLIAAAPDIYEVLREIVNKWGFPNTPDWHKANDALKKAEGK